MKGFKSLLVYGVAASALSASAAAAQDAVRNEAEQSLDEVVVTGSRITTGFQTPTPVTATAAEELKAIAPRNLADGLNQLPVFGGSLKTYQTTGGGLGSGDAGQNLLNLRNLDANRVLVLLDGRRVVATNNRGSVDINVLPQNLVSRVEVVTGGASAAYGSDAVAGVVNFVLDTKFEGFKGEVQGGISTYGDSPSFQANLAFGRQLLDGRMRFVASGEYAREDGVGILDEEERKWRRNAPGQLQNPVAGGIPSTIIVTHLKSALGSYGGLISSGPLRGTHFVDGGRSAVFQYARLVSGTYMGGGPSDPLAGYAGNGLSPDSRRGNVFAHVEYDVTPGVMLFADAMYARSTVRLEGAHNFGTGAAGQLTIFRDNAYLPADILARMVAANVQSVPLGRYYLEFGPVENESEMDVYRASAGLKGALAGSWKWDTSYAYGRTEQRLAKNNMPHLRQYFAASDAVRNAAGAIVCRSTLAGFDPGCVPMNPFGPGSVTAAAGDYILGNSYADLKLEQHVVAANLSGDLGESLQLGAGPIGVAVGAEYRKEKADQTSDAISQERISLTGLRTGVAPANLANRLGPYQFYNPQPFSGSYDIKEVYGELAVPVLRDLPFAQLLDLSLAARYADYSQSGGVTTWKYGFNYEVTDELRFRYTKSRDIRGPNVVELFNTQTQTTSNVVFQGATTQATFIQSGNPNLDPEEGTTETYGAVYRPSWLPGFQVSLDRYEIDIKGAIGTLSLQQTIDQCAAGNQLACTQFTVTPGFITGRLQPLNLNAQKVAGYDFELVYNTPVDGGDLTLRALVNHTTEAVRLVTGGAPIESLRSPNNPRWSGLFSANYRKGPWSFILSERFIGKALNDPNMTDAQLEANQLPAMAYTNVSVRYKFEMADGEYEAFATVSNLFDTSPPTSTKRPSSYNEAVNLAYDTLGRYFTVGLRVALP